MARRVVRHGCLPLQSRPDPRRRLFPPLLSGGQMFCIRLTPCWLAAVAALVLSFGAGAQAQPAAATAGDKATVVVDPSLAGIDSLLTNMYPPGGPGAAVLVARDDRVLLRQAYGAASVELGVPLRPEHVFRIGSITKQFTAVAVLLLVDEGRVALEDDITRHLADYPSHGHRITIEHLLTHTSGIRSYTSLE